MAESNEHWEYNVLLLRKSIIGWERATVCWQEDNGLLMQDYPVPDAFEYEWGRLNECLSVIDNDNLLSKRLCLGLL